MILDQLFYNQKPSSSDSSLRSITKAITWRILGTLDTVMISYFIIGNISMAFSIGSIELLTKMVLYFVHERLWNLSAWGRKTKEK